MSCCVPKLFRLVLFCSKESLHSSLLSCVSVLNLVCLVQNFSFCLFPCCSTTYFLHPRTHWVHLVHLDELGLLDLYKIKHLQKMCGVLSCCELRIDGIDVCNCKCMYCGRTVPLDVSLSVSHNRSANLSPVPNSKLQHTATARATHAHTSQRATIRQN